jgi:hypothetical protein
MDEDDQDELPEWLLPVMIVVSLALLTAMILFSNI